MLHSLMSASLNENQEEGKRKWLLCSRALIRAGCFLNEQCWQTSTCNALTQRVNRSPCFHWKQYISYCHSRAVSHLGRTSCSEWSPGCSRCGTDRCRNHSCLHSGPSLHMDSHHIHSHLQQETEKEVAFLPGNSVHFQYRMDLSPAAWRRGCAKAFVRWALWIACVLLSSIMEQVSINKQTLFILADLISKGFCAV